MCNGRLAVGIRYALSMKTAVRSGEGMNVAGEELVMEVTCVGAYQTHETAVFIEGGVSVEGTQGL